MGKVTFARFGMNFLKYVLMLNNRWSSLIEFGNDDFVIASIFAGLIFTLSDDIICPRDTMNFSPI